MQHIRFILVILCFLPLSAWSSDTESTQPKLLHSQWYSHSEHIYRFVDIYVPAAYELMVGDSLSDGYLPVLYLLPGIGGYEGSWQEMADAIDTLEALMASGRCAPTILVMPDCSKWPNLGRPTYHNSTLWTCIFRYPWLVQDHAMAYVMSDLIDMIDSTVEQLLDFSADTYEAILYQMPEKQRDLLVSIALDGKAKNISGGDFVKKHRLLSPSSVLSAAKGLLEKDFITQDRNVYSVYDKLFELWIRRMYK